MTIALPRLNDHEPERLAAFMKPTEPRRLQQPVEFQYAFGPGVAPIARVTPDERVVIHTEDCFLGRLSHEDQIPSEVLADSPLNPLTGPIWIEGAESGDTLIVHIEAIQPARDWAISCLLPECGVLASPQGIATDHPPLPERVWFYHQTARGGYAWGDRWEIPWAPMFGTIGTAPAHGSRPSLDAGSHGGNLDVPDVGPGASLHLPVAVPGALFSVGDAHAGQGQGELSGPALEIEAYGTFRFELRKARAIPHPRLETAENVAAIGTGPTLDAAARLAAADLVSWLASDFGFDWLGAYQLLTQVGGLHVGNLVNATVSVVASCPRRYLLDGGGVGRSCPPEEIPLTVPCKTSPSRCMPPPGERPWHLT